MRITNKTGSFVLSAMVILAMTLFVPAARGQSMHSMDAREQGRIWAQDFDSTFWFSGVNPNTGNRVYSTGVRLNERFGLVTGHQVFRQSVGFYTDLQIGTGSNYLSDPGTTFNISNVIVHPGWDGTLFSQTIDLAVVEFGTAWHGPQDLTITSASIGDILNVSGFGRDAVGGSWVGPAQDGFARAFELPVDEFGFSSSVSTDYIRSSFLPLDWRNLLMAGGATSGTSGAGVFNDSGELTALMVGQSGMPEYFMTSYALRLDLYQPWIAANTMVPTPGTFSLLLVSSGLMLRRKR